jgi:hypothetical protein
VSVVIVPLDPVRTLRGNTGVPTGFTPSEQRSTTRVERPPVSEGLGRGLKANSQ